MRISLGWLVHRLKKRKQPASHAIYKLLILKPQGLLWGRLWYKFSHTLVMGINWIFLAGLEDEYSPWKPGRYT